MPPPMPNPTKRMTANPIRPGRYRPGKAVVEEESSDEDEESEDEQQQKKQPSRNIQASSQPTAQRKEREDEDDEGFVTDPDTEDEPTQDVRVAANIKDTRITSTSRADQSSTPMTSDTKAESAGENGEDEDDEFSDESSDEDSSEDEQPQRKFQRPTFIKKSTRDAISSSDGWVGAAATALDTREIDEQTRRLAQAELLIKDKLERDLLARAQGRRAWDDDDEVLPEAAVDDTDGLDPEAEYAAWKVRELKRLKRDREAIEVREREIEELERRRALTAEEREKEDREFLEKQKNEKEEGRGQAGYLARYHHKGAFFQDDEAAEILKKRDLMGAKFEDQIGDKSVLPEYMRIRDMTKLGKKGRTRYTDLRGEDTGRFGDQVKRWRGSGGGPERTENGIDLRGVDERFQPDRDRPGGRDGPTGANASIVGQPRVRRSRSRSRSPTRKDDKEHGDSYRPRRRSNSRSRSPPRRKRSPSPYRDRDKRRKVDAL